MKTRHLFECAIAAVAIGSVSAADAQSAPGPAVVPTAPAANGQQAVASPAANDGVVDIIVTAERRENRLQDVPLAITAISGAAIERNAVVNFRDLIQSAPSVTLIARNPQSQNIVIRGISSGAVTSATGFYLNETPLASSYTSGGVNLDLYDVSRIEVLRGPQGTLFGAGSMGGTVRVITNQPDTRQISGSADVIGALVNGKAGTVTVHAMLNVPVVTDKLAIRVVGSFRRAEGFIDDPLAGKKGVNSNALEAVRAEALWTPTDRFSATLTGVYQNSTYDGQQAIDVTPSLKPIYGDLAQHRDIPEVSTSRTAIANLVLKYDFDWASLLSTTSYINLHTTSPSDYSSAIGVLLPGQPKYFALVDARAKSTIEEVRLASSSHEPFSWLIGAYFQHQYIPVKREDTILAPSPLASIPPLTLDTRYTSDTYAAFGEATYYFTHQISVTAGLRYTDNEIVYPQTIYGLLVGRPSPLLAFSGSPKASSSSLTPKIELTYKPDADKLFYALASKGFRPGGPNLNIPGIDSKTGQPVPASFQSDSLWNYEIGTKTSSFNRKLTFDVALYYIDWKNIQTLTTTSSQIPYLANVGSATSKGIEVELQARPSPHWTLALSGSYDNAKYTRDAIALGVVSGDRVAQVPNLSGSASVEYRRPVGTNVDGFAQLSGRYVGGFPMGYTGADIGISTRSYAVADVQLGADVGDKYTVSLFVKNFTDVRGQTYIATDQFRVFILEPRSVGVRLSGRF